MFYRPLNLPDNSAARICTKSGSMVTKKIAMVVSDDYLKELCRLKLFPAIELGNSRLRPNGEPQLPHVKDTG
jgi:hypothetical protein